MPHAGDPVRLVRPAAGVRLVDVHVDPVEHAVHAPLRVADGCVQIVGEDRLHRREPFQSAGDGDAELLEHGEIELLAAVRAGERQARGALGGRGRGHLVDRAVEVADLLQPVPDVAAAVAAHDASVPTNREHNPASRPLELGGDLLSAGSGADDEDAAVGNRARVPVAVGVNLQHVSRRRRSGGGDGRVGRVAGGDDDVVRLPRARVGVDAEARAANARRLSP